MFQIATKTDSACPFTRSGDDLVLTVPVPLVDALSGPTPPATFTRTITTLDGRPLRFDIPYPSVRSGGKPLKNGLEIRVKGEGMPLSKTGGVTRGDLIVRVEVIMPNHVTGEQASKLREILG